MTAPAAYGSLILSQECGGNRHMLLGRPVHCGAFLLIEVAPDMWAPCRYECELFRPNPVPDIIFGCGHLVPIDDARFAWPEER